MQPRHLTTKNGLPLTIRRAVPSDAPAIIAHVEKVSGESDNLTFGPGEFGITLEQETETLARAAEGDAQLFVVAVIGDQVIGMLNFAAASSRPRRRHIAEFGMGVEAAYWGQGIGGALLDAAIAWARAGGRLTKINLRVRTDNARAIALYVSRGFVMEGTLSRDLRVNGVYFDNHCMGLAL
jgi:RimJ/RimL family protein N-acetyltransferase